MKRWCLSLALVTIGSGVAVLSWMNDAKPVSGAGTSGPGVADASGTVPTPPLTTTGRKYLQEYWGSRWPELESRIPDDKKALLDQLVDPAEIPTWEVAERWIRAQRREGRQSERTSSLQAAHDKHSAIDLEAAPLNPAHKALNEKERQRIQEIVHRDVEQLDVLEALAYDLISEAEESTWDDQLYQAFPLVGFPTSTRGSGRGCWFHEERLTGYYWVVFFTIDSARFPKLDQVVEQIHALELQTRQDILEAIEGI